MLRKCSKRKGIRGFLLRKDLLTRIKQCDVELSNVLQAFHVRASISVIVSIELQIFLQAALSLDTHMTLIAMRREVRDILVLNKCTWLTIVKAAPDSGPLEAIS